MSTGPDPWSFEAPDPQAATDATRMAVEFVMLWMESDRQAAATHITNVVFDLDPADRIQPVVGLLNLSMWLVFQLAKQVGATDIKQGAAAILQQLSVHLPE